MFKGVIQFGLVTVGCRLYLAVDPHSTGAHLLHAECLGRIQQKTWCPHCEREITRPETVRGFPIGDGRYVTITDDEFATLPVETLHAIKVAHFVTLAEAATLETWSRQPYYLAPEDLGRRAFALLCATLEETGLAAIAKLTIREREHVATIRVLGDGLLLTTLAWPEEIRPIESLDLPSHAEVPDAELKLARDLVLCDAAALRAGGVPGRVRGCAPATRRVQGRRCGIRAAGRSPVGRHRRPDGRPPGERRCRRVRERRRPQAGACPQGGADPQGPGKPDRRAGARCVGRARNDRNVGHDRHGRHRRDPGGVVGSLASQPPHWSPPMPEPRRSDPPQTPAPLARWDDDGSAHPDLVWWAQLDERYLVEAVRAGTPGRADLRIYDHLRADALVASHPVAMTGDATFGPSLGDIVAWQRLAIATVDGQSRAVTQKGDPQ